MSYRISGPWRFLCDDWAHGRHIVVEVADLVDDRGRVYDQGAYHVKLDGPAVADDLELERAQAFVRDHFVVIPVGFEGGAS